MEAKLVVNLLPGNNQTDEELQDLVDDVNDIFSQCGHISFTLDSSDINRLTNYPEGFNHDENDEIIACGATDENYRNAANPEIENGGYKIFSAHSILDSGGDGVNGETYMEKPISIVTRNRSIDGDGHTWAHEIGHGLGLDHSDDPNNLMHPFRRKSDGSPSGISLTEDQCKKVIENFLKLNPVVERTNAQLAFIPGERTATTVLVSTSPVDFNGNVVKGFEHLDIHAARLIFYRSPTLKELELEIFLSGLFPRDIPVEASYFIPLDTDNNKNTGKSFNGFKGIDKIISLEFKGKFPFRAPHGTSVARVVDNDNGIHPEPGVEELRPPEIIEHFKFIDYPNPIDLTKVAPKGKPDESIVVKIPLALLGEIADKVDIGFEASSGNIAATSQEQFFIPTNIIKPNVKANVLVINGGENVFLSGSNFAPNSEVKFFWNNKLKKPIAFTTTNEIGIFSTSIKIPKAVAGDYVLDIIDSKGNVDIAVFTVIEKESKSFNGTWTILFFIGFLMLLVFLFLQKRKIGKK